MRITTTRFGRIDVAAGDVLRFPSGLPGLEDCREWALLADADNDALGWLQSTTRADVALAVVSPRRFVPGYQVRIPRSELLPLDIADVRQAQVVVVVGRTGTTLTLNLKVGSTVVAQYIGNLSAQKSATILVNDILNDQKPIVEITGTAYANYATAAKGLIVTLIGVVSP